MKYLPADINNSYSFLSKTNLLKHKKPENRIPYYISANSNIRRLIFLYFTEYTIYYLRMPFICFLI